MMLDMLCAETVLGAAVPARGGVLRRRSAPAVIGARCAEHPQQEARRSSAPPAQGASRAHVHFEVTTCATPAKLESRIHRISLMRLRWHLRLAVEAWYHKSGRIRDQSNCSDCQTWPCYVASRKHRYINLRN